MDSTTNETSAPAPLPATSHVGRVALRVADLGRVASFYESVVGLDRLDTDGDETSDDRATLGAGDTPLLELAARPELPERGRDETGLFHAAFLFPDRGALGDALARVEAEWRLDGASDHRVSEALYLTDPEGNGVELYRDRPGEQWPTADGRVQMDTLPLDLDALRADATGDDGAPDETTVGHIHLEVSSVPDSRAFYVEELGMNLRQEGSGAAFVAAGDYHHHVGLNSWNDRRGPGDGLGLDWFELVVPDAETLDALATHLDARGDVFERSDDGLTVEDPDRIAVRVRVEE
ncbi:VOC family protein [Halomarina salina]|uniref:VOC family protein n=1 Tax=Halomarina salina TaxID=1872699 RepID=A0ABD5RPU8_9EURY|nr:VOC family protein [Halomarina salina]